MAVIGDFVEQEMGGGEVPQGSCGTERLHSGVISVLEGKKQARVGRTSLVVVVSYATAYSAWFGIFCSSYIYKIPGLVTKIGASVTACT